MAGGARSESGGTGALGDPGDVGRRVAHRRNELGLSRAEVAAAVGMAPGYLDYLEERPAQVTASALYALAIALDTSVAYLLGEGISLAPGRGQAGERPRVETLSPEECVELLTTGGVGRVVMVEERGPVAIPVNFAMLDGDIVFRTVAHSPVAAADSCEVGFEVDRIDDAMQEGWSVLVTGRARSVTDPDEQARVRAMELDSWAGGERDVFLRITPDQVSGRRILVQR